MTQRTMMMSVAGEVRDPYYANVTLLAHMDGSNGGTTFTDNSPVARSLTANSATTSSTQVKFGTASGSFNGSNAYVSATASTDFAFPGDFTIEFWAWKSTDNTNGYDVVSTVDTTNGSGINGWTLELSSIRGFVFASTTGGGIIASYATNPNDSTWHYWVISRSGSTVRLFKDGTVVATSTSATSFPALGQFGIGRNVNVTSYPFNGYIDEMRITKGVARYTANFTPPTKAFPNS